MHAIVEIAGKQFRVTNNEKIKVPLLSAKEGENVSFDKVFFLEDDKGNSTIGSPVIDKMSVGATVLEHGRDKKIIVFKKKRRKGYQKKNGHRQGYSLIEINDISAAKMAAKKPAPAKAKTEEVKTEKKTAAKPVAEKKVAEIKTAKKTAAKPAVKKATTEKSKTVKATEAKTKTLAEKPKATKTPVTKKAEPKAKAKEE